MSENFWVVTAEYWIERLGSAERAIAYMQSGECLLQKPLADSLVEIIKNRETIH